MQFRLNLDNIIEILGDLKLKGEDLKKANELYTKLLEARDAILLDAVEEQAGDKVIIH